MVDAANHAVKVYPPDIVKRRTVTWDGVAAEIVQATRREKDGVALSRPARRRTPKRFPVRAQKWTAPLEVDRLALSD